MDGASVEQLRAQYLYLASGCGEPEPADLKYVFSTRRSADDALYGSNTSGADSPVVVITARGSFAPIGRPSFARGAERRLAPSGDQHLTGIWTLPDFVIVDYSIGQGDQDLTALGTVGYI